MNRFSYIILFLALLGNQEIYSQVFIDAGLGFSGVRDHVFLVGNVTPRPNFHTGVNYATKVNPNGGDNVAFQFGFQIVQKGYIQEIDLVRYRTRFYFLSLPVSVRYVVADMFSIDAGIEANGLFDASMNTENRAKVSTLSIYENFDLSGRLRLGLFAAERIEPFLQVSYGITPSLKYRRFDNFGNDLGEVELLKNFVYSLGIRINFKNE